MKNRWNNLTKGKKALVITISFFVIFGAIFNTDETIDVSKKTEDVKEASDADSNKSDEDKFYEIVETIAGEKLIDIEHKEVTNHINVYIKTAGLSSKMDYKSSLNDVKRILRETKDIDYNSIYVEYKGDVVNMYGDVREEKLITYDFSRDTIDKINFDNLILKNIPNVADGHWISPIIAKDLN